MYLFCSAVLYMFPTIVSLPQYEFPLWGSIESNLITSHLILLHIVHTGVEHRAQVRQVEYCQGAKCYVNDVDP